MLVNSGVARFQDFAHEWWRQFWNSGVHSSESLVSPPTSIHLLSKQCGSAWTFLLSQGKPLWRAVRQGTGEALSSQSHLRLLATRPRDGVYAILLQSEPFLNSIRHLYGTSSTRKIVATMIVAAFAGLALIILMLLKMGMGNQVGIEHAGTVKGATPSVAQVPIGQFSMTHSAINLAALRHRNLWTT